MENKYKPINCDFHELLLAKATLKQVCEITFIENNEQITTQSLIIDVYTKKGEEFLVLNTGKIIRLDYIISVDNTQMPTFSCTF